MDATANELEDIKVLNFPTLTLYKKETNEVRTFRTSIPQPYIYSTLEMCIYFDNLFCCCRLWNITERGRLKVFPNLSKAVARMAKLQKRYVKELFLIEKK